MSNLKSIKIDVASSFNGKADSELKLSNSNQENELGRTTTVEVDDKKIEIDFDDLVRVKGLGTGRYGIVLKFKHKKSDLELAVKRINIVSRDDERKKDLMDLKVPLKAGQSEFIVKFYGGLFAEGYIWVLSEVMDASLDKFYTQAKTKVEKLDELFISKVAYSVLMAIEFLKSKSIMHRDIKPSNMLINYAGKIKLCDFGISGFMSNSVCLTYNGCHQYMAPERLMDSKNLSGSGGYTIKSDIWSLGISIYEIATFTHPFENLDTYCARMTGILTDKPPRLPETKFTPLICSFIECCLVKEPKDRGDLKLLNHIFIKSYLNEQINLEFVKEILDLIKTNSKDEE